MSSLPGEIDRRSASVPRSPWHAHTGELMNRLGEPLIGGNRVVLLDSGPATVAAMLRAIEGARDHVNIEGCIVQADGPGEAIAHLLAERCAEGVRVNLLLDSVSALTHASPFFARLRRRGVSLCEHVPVPRWRALAGLALTAHGHRKLMVVDGRIGIVGSADARPAQHDLHVQVEGPVVQHLQRLFIAHWQRHAAAPMQQARYFRPLSPVGTQRVGVVAGDGGGRRDPGGDTLLGAIDTAGQRVLLAATDLALPRRLLRKLLHAAGRGVAVEMLLPAHGDAWPGPHGAHARVARLLEAGARIHARHGAQRHAKACVIDGVWSSIGSATWDAAGLRREPEAGLVVLDEDVGARLEALLHADAADAHALDLTAWRQCSAWTRMRAALARRAEALF